MSEYICTADYCPYRDPMYYCRSPEENCQFRKSFLGYDFYKTLGDLQTNIIEVPHKMTNADRIRAMNDEELATLLTDVAKKSAGGLCGSLKTVYVDISNCDFDLLYKMHLDWLKKEVEE